MKTLFDLCQFNYYLKNTLGNPDPFKKIEIKGYNFA